MEKDGKLRIIGLVVGVLLIAGVTLTSFWIYDKGEEPIASDITTKASKVYEDEDYYSENIVTYKNYKYKRGYINLDSKYANEANSEIKKIIENNINKNESAYEGSNFDPMYLNSFIDSSNGNILSILLETTYNTRAKITHTYNTFNIDITTGNKLSYEEIYKYAGFAKDNIESKVKESIKVEMKDLNVDYQDDETFNSYYNKTVSEYIDSVNDNNVKYYLNSNGKLIVVVKAYIPKGDGESEIEVLVNN